MRSTQLREIAVHPRRPRLAWAAAALLLAACDAPQTAMTGPGVAPPADLQRHLAAGAAASLGPDGRFALAAPSAPGNRPIITPERAGELALAALRTWGPSLLPSLQKQAGRSFDLATLRVDPRILFARTPYGRFPDGYHPAFSRAYGPYYLVTLRSGGDAVLQVSVAAYNEAARVDEKGLVHRPQDTGAEFFIEAIPADGRLQLVSPEAAVDEVARATGARVTATPELVRLEMPYSPAVSAWKVTLDREVPVQARGKGTTHRVRELFVGPLRERRVMMASRGGARAVRTSAIPLGAGDDRVDAVDVPILAGEAVSFEPVNIVPGGSQ